MRTRLVPAFPGYIFVSVEAPQTVRLPKNAFGFLRNTDRSFACMHPDHFNALWEMEKEMRALFQKDDAPTGFQIGDKVRFSDTHVFAGFEARVRGFEEQLAYLELVNSALEVKAEIGCLTAGGS